MALDTPYVRGASKLKRRIETIRAGLALPVVMDGVKDLLLARTLRRFAREVTPNEVPWVPLAPSTLRIKKALGFGDRQKLVRKGNMRDAIAVIRGGAGSTFTNTGAGFRIGIQDPDIAAYGRVQNRGSDRIPARQFLGIGALDVKAVDSLLRRKARDALGK